MTALFNLISEYPVGSSFIAFVGIWAAWIAYEIKHAQDYDGKDF